jgi:hypothetical protein
MSTENRNGFHFGLEAKLLLVDSAAFRPIWHSQARLADSLDETSFANHHGGMGPRH